MKIARREALRLLGVMMAGCLVLPVMLFAYAAWRLDRDLHREAEQTISINLDVLEQHALRVFQSAELALNAMGLLTADLTDDQIEAREPELHVALKDLLHGLPEIQSIWVIGHDGLAQVSNLVSPMPRVDVSHRQYFQALAAGEERTYVGMVSMPELKGEAPFFTLDRRRNTADGRYNGALVVALRPADFEHFYSQLDPRRTGQYEMVRSDGAVLARFPALSRAEFFLDPERSNFLREMHRHPDGGRFTARSNVDGIERIVGFRPIVGYPVYLITGIQTEALRAAWRSTVASYLLFGVPVTLLLSLALLIAMHRTRRFYAEAERRRAAELALSRTRRLEALGQLTGGVAHDFNNLLMIVHGSAERLRRRVTDAADTRSLDMIEGAVQRGAALTRQLLTFASRQPLAVEVIDLAQHIVRFEEMVRRSLRGDIETIVEAASAPCLVKVDPGELDLALLNITVNARDAMPNGGRLSLTVRPVVLDGGQAVDGLTGSFIAVSVTDTGSGIPSEALSRVFEPFFTTKEPGKGTGLGLSQVYGFARQSGGTVTLTSKVGSGTNVTLYLPSTTETPRLREARETADRAGAEGRRLLLVEDNSDVAEVQGALLRDLGFDVEIVSCARQALDRLEAGRQFDFVLSDIVMAGELNGIDLARELKRRCPDLPVLLTSGYSASAEQATREGFRILSKPYDASRLQEAIEDMMRHREPPSRERGAQDREPESPMSMA